jgi:hypothetical protein
LAAPQKLDNNDKSILDALINVVAPAKTGGPVFSKPLILMETGFRRDDEAGDFSTFFEGINFVALIVILCKSRGIK